MAVCERRILACRFLFKFNIYFTYQDVDYQTIRSFLSLLYLGEVKVESHAEVDRVHELCQMFCIVFPPKSIAFVVRPKVVDLSDGESDDEVTTTTSRLNLSFW